MSDPSVRLPAAALHVLSRRCAALGPVGVAILREAGREAGVRLFDGLEALPEDLAPEAFWEAVDRRLGALDLGSVRFEPASGAVGSVLWYRSPEVAPGAEGTFAGAGRDGDGSGPAARGDGSEPPAPGCHLATGLLAGLLTRAAGRPVAVLEVECGRAAVPFCRFLFGAPARLREVHAGLASGASPSEALAAPGAAADR